MTAAVPIQVGESHAGLSQHEHQEVGLELQATLVALIDLALVGKQLHWSVVGPHFRPLHLQLDELVASWSTLADTVAERALAIGFWPDGQAGVVASSAERAPVPAGALPDHDVVHELTVRLIAVAGHARTRMDRLAALDLASQDVLVDVVRTLEEQLWMIRASRAV